MIVSRYRCQEKGVMKMDIYAIAGTRYTIGMEKYGNIKTWGMMKTAIYGE